jgi:hypothetical protein
MIYDFCQLTTSLLLFHSEEDVHELSKLPMIKHLQYFLGMWNDRYAGISNESQDSSYAPSSAEKQKTPTPASVAEDRRQWPAYQLSMILMNGRDDAELAAITAARLSKGGMSRCALKGCNRTSAVDGGSLLQCSQCGTVRYVRECLLFTSILLDLLKTCASAPNNIKDKHGAIPKSCTRRCAMQPHTEGVS